MELENVVFQRKEEDRRQAELSGCAIDTRHRPLSPPLRSPEEVNHLNWHSCFTAYYMLHNLSLFLFPAADVTSARRIVTPVLRLC